MLSCGCGVSAHTVAARLRRAFGFDRVRVTMRVTVTVLTVTVKLYGSMVRIPNSFCRQSSSAVRAPRGSRPAEACAALNVRLALGPDLVLFTVPRPYGTFLVDCKPPKPKLYDFPTTGVPCIELEDGCAYMIPAGEVGSVDYLVEHMTYAHPLGPGEEWAGVEQPERKAWVYRAVKPSHAQWYSQHWHHQMCPPSHAELLYGESQRDKVWG